LERKRNIGGLVVERISQMNRVGQGSESAFRAIHDSVSARFLPKGRSSTMRVPDGTAVSSPSVYLGRSVAYGGRRVSGVASWLRCVSERPVVSASPSVRCVVSASVSKRAVALRKGSVASASGRVPSCPVASAYDRVSGSAVASASKVSPKLALAPVLLSLRRVAQANRFARIAGRLGRLARGKPRQQLH
jgi:hypothetical protein